MTRRYFYPRSPYGERPRSVAPWQAECTISIHALLTESDHQQKCRDRKAYVNFYPRSPYGERPAGHNHRAVFNLISIHALLTESDAERPFHCFLFAGISIHALLTESDSSSRHTLQSPSNFYPRSPYGERPSAAAAGAQVNHISIHALLTESDCFAAQCRRPALYFYPRSPYGERLPGLKDRAKSGVFLSTLSLRRATWRHWPNWCVVVDFYPRSPYGERLLSNKALSFMADISIHALLTESDLSVPK